MNTHHPLLIATLRGIRSLSLRLFPLRRHHSWYTSFLLLLPILITFITFGTWHLGNFITADEHYWVDERIPAYWDAWETGKWKKTYINDKPGVSLALISGPALFFTPAHPDTLCQDAQPGQYIHCDPDVTQFIYRAFRFPLLLINTLLLIVIFFAIQTFSSLLVAALTTWFIVTSPILIGFSQIINPDSLLWSFGSASFFTFLAFLKTGRVRYAGWTIFALLCALLSKYTALILIFFFPLIVLILSLLNPQYSPLTYSKRLTWLFGISITPIGLFLLCVPGVLSSQEHISAFFTAGTTSLLPWFLYSALCVSLFFVPSLEKHHHSITIFGVRLLRISTIILLCSICILIIGRLFFSQWIIFDTLPFDLKNLTSAQHFTGNVLSPVDTFFLELSPLVYGTPLLTLLFSITVLGFAALKKTARHTSSLIFLTTFFLLLFLSALATSGILTTPRYSILCFPLLAFLAALGIEHIWSILPSRYTTRIFSQLGIALILLFSLGSLLSSTPYYTNFSNLLLPRHALISDSWGYGGYEAALYLNTLPNARNLTIWSDYYGVCEFFIGRCITDYAYDRALTPDYYVLTRRGKLRYTPKAAKFETLSGLTAYRYYDKHIPVWSLFINGKPENFVMVFQTDPKP